MATTDDVALLRLVAQRLVGPPVGGPAEVVAWLTAMQAQDLPGVLESVALRSGHGSGEARGSGEAHEPEEGAPSLEGVRAAFDAGAIVRTWPMRGTLHAVAAADASWITELLAARPMRAMARRRSELALSDADVDLARETLVDALAGSGALVRADVLARWTDVGLTVTGSRGYHLLVLFAHERLVCLGPMRGKEQAFVLLDAWVPGHRRLGVDLDRDGALGELALRYLRSHGPATESDLARWTGLPLRDVRAGIALAADGLATLEVDGVIHHLDPATPDLLAQHRTAARGVHLLPGFDEIVLGYADRSATVPPEHAERIVPGGNGVFRATVLHGGVAVGTWRRTGTGKNRRLVAEPFSAFSPTVTARLDALRAAR